MRLLTVVYVTASIFCILYLISFYALLVLLKSHTFASEISMLVFYIGMSSLWLLPFVPISYFFRNIRNGVNIQLGVKRAVSCVVITTLFEVLGLLQLLLAISSI